MNFRLRFIKLLFLFIGLSLVSLATGCDSWQAITYVNQTHSRVKVDLGVVSIDYTGTPNLTWSDTGDIIESSQSKKLVTPVRTSSKSNTLYKYTVVAVNENNEIMFSKVFTWDELHDAGWKVIIAQLQNP